jgi:DNA primase
MPAIDFALFRSRMTMQQVLGLLQFVPVRRRGDQLRGPCPVHGSSSPTSHSFSVHLRKNAFRCFTCGAAGNQLDLWAAVQGLSTYDAALDLAERLSVPIPWLDTPPRCLSTRTEKRNP